jgi:hypothetical protein
MPESSSERSPVKSHPNATAAILATYVASILGYTASQLGLDLPNEVAMSAAGLIVAAMLAAGRHLPK